MPMREAPAPGARTQRGGSLARRAREAERAHGPPPLEALAASTRPSGQCVPARAVHTMAVAGSPSAGSSAPPVHVDWRGILSAGASGAALSVPAPTTLY